MSALPSQRARGCRASPTPRGRRVGRPLPLRAPEPPQIPRRRGVGRRHARANKAAAAADAAAAFHQRASERPVGGEFFLNNIPVLWLRKRTHTSTSTYKDTEYSCPPNFTKRTSREKKIATKSLVPFPSNSDAGRKRHRRDLKELHRLKALVSRSCRPTRRLERCRR